MAEPPTVEVFADVDDIPAGVATRLSLKSGVAFFRSLEWFRCLARHGTDSGAPRIYLAGNDAAVCALYCLQRERRLASLSNFYTIEYGPTGSAPGTGDALRAILDCIAGEQARWTTLEFRNLPEADLAALSGAASAAGFVTHTWEQHDNWYLDLDGRNFDRYYAGLPSRLRNTIERKGRKADREHDLRIAIFPDDGLSPDDAVGHFQAIYAASWKEPEPFPAFMPALIRSCGDAGTARVGMAWVDGEPAAAQFWIRDGNRSFIYKLAYDEKFGELSVGSILSKALFRHAIDVDGVTEIDYGVGNEAYKRDWMSDRRKLAGLLCCNPRTLAGRLRNLREALAARVRRSR